ncbi:hypothetical protein T492DRAFT_983309 [Pavlovales sp. CCMP2436]|nr:hypothetical protein T492DRAFT_983309 [Pavlovales sp. CCMP2436]
MTPLLVSLLGLVQSELSRRGFASLPFVAALPGFSRLSLGDRLALRDPSQLAKPLFSSYASQTGYPAWLAGTWDVEQAFDGFVFPSKRITRAQIMNQPTVPGLQKLSVVSIPDMGKTPTRFQMRFSTPDGWAGRCFEDKAFNLASMVDGSLEARLVQKIEYSAAQNPNRLSVIFRPGKTRNAERVELFYNAREAEDVSEDLFVASEHLRQVTFSGSPDGAVRQVSTSYGQYQTFTRLRDGSGRVRLNLLTAAYLEPTEQEALYFDAVDQPVIVYSHEAMLRAAPPPEVVPPSPSVSEVVVYPF